MQNQTKSFTRSDVEDKWFVVDATDLVLGRMAAIVADRLRGKHNVKYTPNADCGDNIIIINAEKITLTGKKMTDKIYYHHTGYPGGLKDTTPEKRLAGGKPESVVFDAIKRMLPKTKLADKVVKKLHVYAGEAHPHTAQNPAKLDIASMNSKNKRG